LGQSEFVAPGLAWRLGPKIRPGEGPKYPPRFPRAKIARSGQFAGRLGS
jgi:hypothetical protein